MNIEKFNFVDDPDQISSEDIVDVGTGVILGLDRKHPYTASIFQRYDENGDPVATYCYSIINMDSKPDYEQSKKDGLLGEVDIVNEDRKAAWKKTVDTINSNFKAFYEKLHQ